MAGKQYSDLFTNVDDIACPVTSCELKSADCSATFSSTHITLDNTDPDFPVTAVTSV